MNHQCVIGYGLGIAFSLGIWWLAYRLVMG